MGKVVPDSNALISYFKEEEPIASVIKSSILSRNLVLSIISVAEFLVKATRIQKKNLLELIDILGVQVVDLEITEQAVKYRKSALKKSKRVLLLDCIIAATAKLNNATLLTFDKRDFPFRGVRVKEV